VQGVDQEKIDLFRAEQGTFVQGMTRLATGLAFIPSRSQRRGRLDDVRRGRFGGSRGVFARGGELLLQTSHGSLQPLELQALLLELRLQPLASGTGIRRCFCHARVLFSPCPNGKLGVNAHGKPIVQEWLRRHREFHLEPVPPYSPNVNLIERLWRFLKGKALCRWHQSFEAMQEAVSAVLDHLEQYRDELATLMVEKFHIIEKPEIPIEYKGVA
jgi:hypothetical protein